MKNAENGIYLDHEKVPTIGVGYNLRNPDVLKGVLKQFGYTDKTLSPDDFANLLEALSQIFNDSWTDSNKEKKISDINSKLDKYKEKMDDAADKDAAHETFVFKDKDGESGFDDKDIPKTANEMEPVFDEAIKDFEQKIVARIKSLLNYEDSADAQAVWDGLGQSQKDSVLSLIFNGGPKIMGVKLATALRDKNWADAYFEIVYGSNREKDYSGDKKVDGRSYGLQVRRIAEGAKFIDGISAEDKKKLFNKLKDNKKTIEKYLDAVVDLPASGGYRELSKDRHDKLFNDLNDFMDDLRSDLAEEGIFVNDVNFNSSKVILSPNLHDVDQPARIDPLPDPNAPPPNNQGPVNPPPPPPEPTDPSEPSTPPADPIISIKTNEMNGYTKTEVYFNDDSGTSKILMAIPHHNPEETTDSGYFIGFPNSNQHNAMVLRNPDGTLTYRFVDKKGNEATDLTLGSDKKTIDLTHPIKDANGEWTRWEDVIRRDRLPTPPPPPPPGPTPNSPLVLDLDGDGIETIGLSKGIYFDHEGDGFKELTGFVGSDDGLLVLDRNSDGFINNGLELFGNSTVLKTGLNAKHGFEALAELDGNNDRIIDGKDTIFSDLRVWQDANQNGLTDVGELHRLIDIGVAALNTSFTNGFEIDANNNGHLQISSYTTADGEVRKLHDVWFDRNLTLTESDELPVPADIMLLPNTKAYGKLNSLHQIMVRDTSGVLKELVNQFLAAGTHAERIQITEKIIFSMAGQTGNYQPYYQSPVDSRRIYALEAYYGYKFDRPRGTGTQYAEMYNRYFDQMASTVFYQLSMGGYLAQIFSLIGWAKNPDGDGWIGDFSSLPDVLLEEANADPESFLDLLSGLVRAIKGVNPYDDSNVNLTRLSVQFNEYASEINLAEENVVSIDLIKLALMTANTSFGEVTPGSILGGRGDDTLISTNADDILIGGYGNDIYRFMARDGLDLISNIGGGNDFDVIELLGSLPTDVRLRRQDSDLVIVTYVGHEITVKNFFDNKSGALNEAGAIDQILFKNGAMWDVAKIKSELLKITNGNDVIFGYETGEILTGGRGNDTLQGLGGDDVYTYSPGDGNDVLIDRSGKNTLLFSEGIDKSQLKFNRFNDNLFISLNTGQWISIEGIYADGATGTDRYTGVKFSDDSVLSMEEINLLVLQPSNKSETYLGFNTDDYIVGGKGDDTLDGGKGDDTYIYNVGDGHDIIHDSAGVDTLQLGVGISSDQVSLSKQSSNLIITFDTGGRVVVNGVFDAVSGQLVSSVIDKIQFTGGEQWDLTRIVMESANGTLRNDELHGYSVGDDLSGRGGDDTIHGYYGDDILRGGAGKDKLVGGIGNDILIGGTGSDSLYGGLGNDEYVLGKDSGYEFIVDEGGIDTIKFSEGISPEDVYIVSYKSGMLLFSKYGQVALVPNNASSIERIEFFNNEAWGASEISQRIQFTQANPEILFPQDLGVAKLFVNGSNLMEGSYPVALKNNSGQYEFIAFGVGHINNIIGNTGSYYIYDGNITFSSYSPEQKMILSNGVLPEDIKVRFYQPYNSAYEIQLIDTKSDLSIHLTNVFRPGLYAANLSSYGAVDSQVVQFLDGTQWTYKDLLEKAILGTANDDTIYTFEEVILNNDIIHAGAGNDFISGSQRNEFLYGEDGDDRIGAGDGNDIVNGGRGNDYISGGKGKNRFEFSLGDGVDTVAIVGGSDDVIHFNEGIAESDLIFNRTPEGHLSISYSQVDKILLEWAFPNPASDKPKLDNLIDRIKFTNEVDEVDFLQLMSSLGYDVSRPVINSVQVDSTGTKVTGIATPGTEVYLDLVSGGTQWRAITDSVTGAFSIELGAAYKNSQAFTVKTFDSGYNASPEISIVAPDLTPPAKPTAALSSDGKTISGTSEVGAIIVVKNTTTNLEIASYTVQNTNGQYSFNLPAALTNGEKLTVFAKDASANPSPSVSLTAKDTTAPLTPTAAFDAAGKVISGTAEAGSTVIVKNAAGTPLKTVVANITTGAYSITLDTALINKETVNVTAKDASGNVSPIKSIIAPDKTPPAIPSASIDATRKIITGVAEAGSVVEVRNTSNVVLGSITANATNGSYTINLPTALAASQTVNVTAKDAAGNVSVARQVVAGGVIDTTPPPQPTASFDSTGKIISGTAEAGSTVVVKNAAGTELKTVTANITTGAYSITLDTALINKETVNVTAKDASGNVSPIKSIIAPDKTPPAIPSASIDATRKIITGVAEAGSVVEVRNTSNVVLGSITANATNGSYTINLPTALAASQTVNVTAKDAAGNVSTAFTAVAPGATPNPASITIQAENYTSMSGVWNEPTTDVGGGQDTGNINTGDWMAYNNVAFNVPATGVYKVTYRVASLNGGGRLALRELSNESVLNSVAIPKTSGWQTWVDVTQEITLSSGTHNFKIYAESGGFNVNWFKLEPVAAATSLAQSAAVFAAANFDLGRMIANYETEFENSNLESGADEPSRLRSQLENLRSGGVNIDSLIQSIASFDPPVGVGSVRVREHMDQVSPVLASTWQ